MKIIQKVKKFVNLSKAGARWRRNFTVKSKKLVDQCPKRELLRNTGFWYLSMMFNRGVHVEPHGKISKAVVPQKFPIGPLINMYFFQFFNLMISPCAGLAKIFEIRNFLVFRDYFNSQDTYKKPLYIFHWYSCHKHACTISRRYHIWFTVRRLDFSKMNIFPIYPFSGARSSRQDRDLKFFVEAYYVCRIII